MQTNELKNLLKKAKGEIPWATQEVGQPSGPLRIFSDPVVRLHTIFLPVVPPEEGPSQELAYLHELGHALLCERVHPFFSSGFPIAGLEKGQVQAVAPVLYTASDWFVGHWMMEFCHDLAMDELKKEYEATAEMMGKGEPDSVEKFFVAVLIIAQSLKYLKVEVDCSGFLGSSVQAFLAVPPEKPSRENLELLVNKLLSLGAPYQCRHSQSEGYDVLEFYRASEK